MTAVQCIGVRRLNASEALGQSLRLRQIFRDAVLIAGPLHYSAEQCAVWATSADDVDRWTVRLDRGTTWIATSLDAPDRPVGFLVLYPADHVDLLYADPAFHRQGVAAALLQAFDRHARVCEVDTYTADASLFAQPVLASQGFELVAWEEVEHKSHSFRRAAMRKLVR